ncbi:MAG: HAD family hydrolase, partial [Comamonas sp.]
MSFDAILFDCDGVLVDSELITNRVLHAMLNESGWALSEDECMRLFIGKTVRSETALIEAQTGQPLTDAWMAAFYERRNERLRAELVAIEGAVEAVRQVHTMLGGKIAVASGADKPKVLMQLDKVGMLPYFGSHVFSGHDLPRTKPWPDVYLAAAASLKVAAERCLVIEDSVPGLTAG